VTVVTQFVDNAFESEVWCEPSEPCINGTTIEWQLEQHFNWEESGRMLVDVHLGGSGQMEPITGAGRAFDPLQRQVTVGTRGSHARERKSAWNNEWVMRAGEAAAQRTSSLEGM
jgi:hypothetical protein